MRRRIHKKKLNITLIELLIVVSIIGIGASVFIPVLTGDFSFLDFISGNF